MPRIIVGCGAIIDTLLGGVGLFGVGECGWLVTILVGGLSLFSPVLFMLPRIVAEAYEHPQVIPQLVPIGSREQHGRLDRCDALYQ